MITQTDEFKARAFEFRNLVFFFLLAFGLTWISAVLLGIFDPQMPTNITDPAILFFVLKEFLGMGSLGTLIVSHLHMDLQQYERKPSTVTADLPQG